MNVIVFCECDSINYFRYGSWYLEVKFVLKARAGHSNAVSPDMKLEQTIQRSKKSSGGIIGETNQGNYITEWELVYHEILAISNCYNDLTCVNHGLENDISPYHHELFGGLGKEMNEAIAKVTEYMNERDNPFLTRSSSNMYFYSTGQLIPTDIAKRLLAFFEDGEKRYKIFRQGR